MERVNRSDIVIPLCNNHRKILRSALTNKKVAKSSSMGMELIYRRRSESFQASKNRNNLIVSKVLIMPRSRKIKMETPNQSCQLCNRELILIVRR